MLQTQASLGILQLWNAVALASSVDIANRKIKKNKGASPAKTGLTARSSERYFRRRITKNATINGPATAYNASKPGKLDPSAVVADYITRLP
jgi:hypothetical protein